MQARSSGHGSTFTPCILHADLELLRFRSLMDVDQDAEPQPQQPVAVAKPSFITRMNRALFAAEQKLKRLVRHKAFNITTEMVRTEDHA